MRFLLWLFIIVPIVEIFILIQVGGLIGVWPTIATVVLTAVIGVNMLRQQSAATLMRANQKMEQGSLPANEMIEGIMLAIGGTLLLTPGFFTDAIGFLCLVPQSRRHIAAHLLAKGVLKSAQFGNFSQGFGGGGFSGFGQTQQSNDDIIEGEFQPEIKDRIDK